MRAVIVDHLGSLEQMRLGELPMPVVSPGEVLVQVHATAANFVDILTIEGRYQFKPQLPFVPGKGPAGAVVEVSEGVAGLHDGDRVLAMAEQGGYGEYVSVPATQCYRLPYSMTYVDAASMALAYDTAWFALRERARLKAGETVLVLGATGGVGFAAVQLAKAMGATVLAGLSSPEKKDLVADADAIIDLGTGDVRNSLREQVYEVTAGQGADIVLDPLGGEVFAAAIRALAWRGRLVVIGFAAGDIPTLKVNYLLLKNIEVSGLQISDYRKRAPDEVAACFAEIFAFFEAGKIKLAQATTVPVTEVRDALESIRSRNVNGRIVLTQG